MPETGNMESQGRKISYNFPPAWLIGLLVNL